MKTSRIISAICILAGIISLSGCEKSGMSQKGKAIRFTASSQKSGVTKSAYSGEGTIANGALTWERINWLEDDAIRVASNYAYMQDSGDGGLTTGIHYADYKVSNITTSDDKTKSLADMAPYVVNSNGTGSNGLVWGEETEGYTFYAVYPCPYTNTNIALGSGDTENNVTTTLGKVTAFLPATQTLASSASTRYVSSTGAVADASGNIFTSATAAGDGALTYSVYQPDMSYAFMTAVTTGVRSDDGGATLSFTPAFTAFEFSLTTADDEEITISKIELIAAGENDYLAGEYSFMAGSLTNVAVNTSVTGDRAASKTVSMTPSSALAINKTTGVALTLFTVPKANTGIISLKLTTNVGTATLEMKDGDNPYVFAAGSKHRINLLKVGNRWKYKITIDPDELPWDKVEEETTFSQNIQSGPFVIENATETGNHYYPEGTKNYQVRTLDMSKDYGTTLGEPNQPFFLVTFKPMAPLGGYWQLIPESNSGMGTAAFKVEVWDTDTNEGSSDLKGQIMNQTVTLHITCNVTDDQRTEDHAIIIRSQFSTSVTFDENSTYSADSEIQDAHKDGSFSYWRFVIPAKVN